MNKYIVLYTPTTGLLDDYKIIEGKSGVDALNNSLPNYMIGKVKRVRGWEEPEYCLQKLEYKDGSNGKDWYRVGSRYWYKYHHPKIYKEKLVETSDTEDLALKDLFDQTHKRIKQKFQVPPIIKVMDDEENAELL